MKIWIVPYPLQLSLNETIEGYTPDRFMPVFEEEGKAVGFAEKMGIPPESILEGTVQYPQLVAPRGEDVLDA